MRSLLPALVALFLLPATAHAETRVVTDGADAMTAGTLRHALSVAEDGDVISVQVPTVTVANGQLEVEDDITIDGLGSEATTLDAHGSSRVMHVAASAPNVTIQGLRMTEGSVTSGDYRGGGCLLYDGTAAAPATPLLKLEDVVLDDCEAKGQAVGGGALFSDGSDVQIVNSALRNSTATITKSSVPGGAAIYSEGGDIELVDSDVSDNAITITAADISAGGGAIYANGGDDVTLDGSSVTGNTLMLATADPAKESDGGGGGVYVMSHRVTVLDSVIRDNVVTVTGPEDLWSSGGGGLHANGSDIDIRRSTVAGNSFRAESGAPGDDGVGGGGIHSNGGKFVLDSSTVSANTLVDATTLDGNAGYNGGGGIYINGMGQGSGIVNSTISGNTATVSNVEESGGGGIYFNGYRGEILNSTIAGNTTNRSGGGIFTGPPLRNTIIAKNTAETGRNCGTYDNEPTTTLEPSGGHNLEDADTCNLRGALDLVNTDPKLGALADNGGPTLTRMIGLDSPALDSAEGCPAGDQRGLARPFGPKCDRGAVENGADRPAPITSPGGTAPTENPPQDKPQAPVVCGGFGTILPPCFGQVPQPNPIVVCGASFGTILPSCDGVGLAVGKGPKPKNLDEVFDFEVGCGKAGQTAANATFGACRVTLSVTVANPPKAAAPKVLPGVPEGRARQSAIRALGQAVAALDEIETTAKPFEGVGLRALAALVDPNPLLQGLLGDFAQTVASMSQKVQDGLLTSIHAMTSPSAPRRSGLTGIIDGILKDSGALTKMSNDILGKLLQSPVSSELQRTLAGLTKAVPGLVQSLGTLDKATSKARLGSGTKGNAPRAVASATRSTASALRILRRVPVAARTVVVPEGGRLKVKLPRPRWTRSVLRPGRRVKLVLRADAIVRGVTVTTTKRETLKLPRR